ncbi:MAG: EF-P beta-lysylation protein EpmB [Moraxella sp.]|nr:EF-P beta-lysylation protein EpmB [Moraxella sp.]
MSQSAIFHRIYATSNEATNNEAINNEPKSNWQQELAQAVNDVDELYRLLELPSEPITHSPKKFPLRVPHAFIHKMKKGDPNDPLLLQVLPAIAETLAIKGYSQDPLDENNHNPIKGLLHKYQSRALITVTGACAVHCRYCFRQHFDYGANLPSTDDMQAIADYLAFDSNINEVLLSGGDPLNISNRRLGAWLAMLAKLPNIRTIRIHTRLPIVLPNRIDDELLGLFKNYPKNIVMVLHANHPNELGYDVKQACQRLKSANITLLNQSVLLKNINDNADTLIALSHALFDAGVLPYYLHVLDKVAGAAHFDVSEKDAVALYWQILPRLSGYLVPKLVQELPNRAFKTPIDIYKSIGIM